MKPTRRTFLKTAALATGASLFPSPVFLRAQDMNSKLNIACIGVGGMGDYSVNNVKRENLVALCDVDSRRAGTNFEKYPNAKRFTDFRKMFDELDGKIDAVTVSTPDHTHAAASVAAMNRGIHCYTEKPLAHDVGEVRKMIELSKTKKVKTQMGTQIHAQQNYRRVVELVQAGAVGKINEVHVWIGSGGNPKPIPPGTFEVPGTLDWNLWLGPTAERDYNPCYLPGTWRYYWAFGSGVFGDFACHYMDLPFWALGLRHPKTIEASGPPVDPQSTPFALKVRYEFPKTENHEALTLTWYDRTPKPVFEKHAVPAWDAGVLFVGSKGTLLSNYDKHVLFPEEKFKDFKRPEPSIPPSPGHHAEWLNAIKNDGETSCNFDYSGTLTETALLGTLAYRVGKKLFWDPVAFKTDDPAATAMLKPPRRKGWEFE